MRPAALSRPCLLGCLTHMACMDWHGPPMLSHRPLMRLPAAQISGRSSMLSSVELMFMLVPATMCMRGVRAHTCIPAAVWCLHACGTHISELLHCLCL
mmetsp:Transcript_19996/g.43612  ORF Transcript_19996/g.43612 Transcript_19996/m.43612 type:complete len:98 (-) Transcript_19996:740-1033(-)